MSDTNEADLSAFRSNWKLQGNAATTANYHLRCIRKLTKPLDEITHADLMAHLADLAEHSSTASMAFTVRALRAYFSWRADYHDVPNPASKLKTVKVP